MAYLVVGGELHVCAVSAGGLHHFHRAGERHDVVVQTVEDALAELKAKDVVRSDVRELTGVTDYMIIASGRSSFMYLQNVFADNRDQSLSLALCMAETMLSGRGAWRVHGGGFAGTTLNFVPLDEVERFVAVMNRTFGEKACSVLMIRPEGAAMLELL